MEMGSVDKIEVEGVYDVEETIFVAVGKNVEKSKKTLLWAVQSFAGKKICVLHVHQYPNFVALTDRKLTVNELKQDAADSSQEHERKVIHGVLDQYCLILSQEGVQAGKVWIVMDDIQKGIVEIIARYNIRWLVMGAAADKHYSKKLAEITSNKAIFVCQHAPIYCQIWFTRKGCLIYTREGRNDQSEAENALALLLTNSDLEADWSQHLRSDFVVKTHQSLDVQEGADYLDRILGRFNNQCAVLSSLSTNTVLGPSKLMQLLTDEEETTQGRIFEKSCQSLELAIIDAKDSKQKTVEEALKRWKEEDNAMEAKCKAKAWESLCVKEISLRKEMEEALVRKRREVEWMKNQCGEFMKELQVVREQNSVLESQIAESHSIVRELEEKIISAVKLLISFKEKRDAARVEHKNAMREVMKLRKLAKGEVVTFCRSEILEFSFMEIIEATHNFDPSWKIVEGRYGSVYKGILRHVHVAIKMLPSYGSQSQLEFQNGVEVLSRVRHPNLVTLIGTCPESSSLVYEYVRNGSLEDRLAYKDKTPPLPWQTRISIAIELCSALIFLHSNEPCIIHGNLKPSKVLLDSNFVCKLGDFGVFHLMPRFENVANTQRTCNETNPNFSVYVDPEYLESGKLTPESDVYSFGVILLQLLTGRPVLGIVKYVTCALEKENFKSVLDYSAGDWPLDQAKQLANLALWCCDQNQLNRPHLVAGIWSVLEPMRASVNDSASCSGLKGLNRVPSDFVCPIFQEVMKDPQIAADGFTYEAEAIREWLKSGHNTSPMTNLKLDHCNLLPNQALHHAIQEWRQHL